MSEKQCAKGLATLTVKRLDFLFVCAPRVTIAQLWDWLKKLFILTPPYLSVIETYQPKAIYFSKILK